MADAVVTLPPDLAAELDRLADATGRSRAELVAEAVARFLMEERQAIDRIVEARLREMAAAGDGRPGPSGTGPGAVEPYHPGWRGPVDRDE